MAQIDNAALYKIGYGLYVITTREGEKDNGMICNTVIQVTSNPLWLSVTINKANYTHDVIRRTGVMNVNTLSESAPFSVFERFGFHSGRDTDKFAGLTVERSENGLAILTAESNSFFSLKVENYVDLGTHGMFLCSVTEAKTLSKGETMTYAYYHVNVKPKPKAAKKKGFVCTICGYVYEGDELPADFICPLCKHPASDFVPLEADAEDSKQQPTQSPNKESTMKQYICEICGYVYDPEVGDPDHGIPAGTPFEQLPDDWTCPTCGVPKDNFKPVE